MKLYGINSTNFMFNDLTNLVVPAVTPPEQDAKDVKDSATSKHKNIL
jgi:hypothetical protein